MSGADSSGDGANKEPDGGDKDEGITAWDGGDEEPWSEETAKDVGEKQDTGDQGAEREESLSTIDEERPSELTSLPPSTLPTPQHPPPPTSVPMHLHPDT